MTRSQIPAHRRAVLALEPHGEFVQATWPERTYRFMFADGSTLDVRSSRDDSDLRAVVLEYHNADQIVGVAVLPEPVAVPVGEQGGLL